MSEEVSEEAEAIVERMRWADYTAIFPFFRIWSRELSVLSFQNIVTVTDENQQIALSEVFLIYLYRFCD